MYNACDVNMIPPHMMGAIERYIEEHCPVGGFLEAVISNNLKEACGRADSVNMGLLPAYVIYFYNEAPAACWGSPEAYARWISAKREKPE